MEIIIIFFHVIFFFIILKNSKWCNQYAPGSFRVCEPARKSYNFAQVRCLFCFLITNLVLRSNAGFTERWDYQMHVKAKLSWCSSEKKKEKKKHVNVVYKEVNGLQIKILKENPCGALINIIISIFFFLKKKTKKKKVEDAWKKKFCSD